MIMVKYGIPLKQFTNYDGYHPAPPTTKIHTTRINLTFRTMSN